MVQYGTPEMQKPMPAGICFCMAVQLELVSPDQLAAA